MDVIFFVIFMALFAGLFGIIGFFGYKKTKTAEDYFVAGRKMGSIVIAFSYGATFISAVAPTKSDRCAFFSPTTTASTPTALKFWRRSPGSFPAMCGWWRRRPISPAFPIRCR